MTDQFISTHITLSQLNELPVLRIHNKQANATIALQGAHLIEYSPVGGTNLLFVSEAETYQQGQAIRGGVPICWPWFGPHRNQPDAPAHGFVRTCEWSHEIVADEPDRTDIRFFLITDGSDPGFPYAARVELLVSIGATLVMSLSTENLGDEPFLISQALHSYFRCNNIDDVRLHGLSGACYNDKVTGENAYVPSDLVINREIDWVIQDSGEAIALIEAGQPRFKLSRIGSRSVILWNPWIEKAKTLSHFNEEEYRQMICIEAANATEDSRLVKPRQSHVLVMEVAGGETH
ncbi:D-hexose-6-phosphate mutarotase [Reinekea blandensis]|uniref:Putative glucose-6-phosphate 1-epimerase n=1 Tax=Reinekea blandensis MED297 TaxID=314283 RepID=A4BC40_9GAMM|nr:D-hexose-6-phosphate mutarotase [Reinekea blandensis]EAR10525.1 hypothetical protein MED297_01850 [Reinekea sp. MED297] [Reinekea blandensis MED297]